MPYIEEIYPVEELELEENPGELELEDNPGELELEDNPGELEDDSADGLPWLEANVAGSLAVSEYDEDQTLWEIPFAADEEEAPPQDETVEVRLLRKGSERLGLVLDSSNVVVALRDGSPAALSGEIFVGDAILAVQGHLCSPERRVAQLLRELPDAAVYAFTLRRALTTAPRTGQSTDVEDHGPLLTPEEQSEYEERDFCRRQELREAVAKMDGNDAEKKALQEQLQLTPRNLSETKYLSGVTKPSAAQTKQMTDMWFRQARDQLARRLNAAEMLKDEGNDKFSEGAYQDALDEYEYALDLFKYEMANLCRDQEEAELGDQGRGLGSEDLPAIQKVRVPCLLNSAACHIKLATKTNLTKALECCAEVLQAGPPAAQRAKAHFRIGQSHFALDNYREAWVALTQAQELNPSSREVRALQAKVSYELKQLKVAERESREGLMTTELNHKQLFKQEKASYAQKLAMLTKLLPEDGGAPSNVSRGRAEALLEQVAAQGWSNLGSSDQMVFSSIWSAAQPRLGATAVREGRDAGVYPPRDEERIFGQNLPQALMSKPFPGPLSWLSAEQRQLARGLALTIWHKGAEDLDMKERRLCEGLELLSMAPHNAAWHSRPLGNGGALLILSRARAHLWPFVPPTLEKMGAIMGREMARDDRDAVNAWARRPMSPGEIGIIQSNVAAWRHAVDKGWEWALVLEDDAKVELRGGALQLLALLPELADAAKGQEQNWQLLCLTPHGLEPFYDLCDPSHIPSLIGEAAPSWARRPKTLGDSGWQRVGPTFHAFGWVYRAPLMKALLAAYDAQAPPLNPVDVWVWEVMATNGMLGAALATKTPLVSTSDTPGGVTSLREAQ